MRGKKAKLIRKLAAKVPTDTPKAARAIYKSMKKEYKKRK